MQVGYNTNIPYKGKIYHVQTEDTGIESYQLISLLYHKGAILVSKKSSYENLKDDPGLKEKVRGLMKEQHKTLCKELIAGKYTIKEEAVPREEKAEVPPPAKATPVPGPPKPETAVTVEPAVISVEVKKELEKEARNLDDILIDFIMSQAGKK